MIWCNEHDITIKDIESVCSDSNIDFSLLDGKNILITGGCGSFGSALVKTLLYLERHGVRLQIYVNTRNISHAEQVFKEFVPEYKNLHFYIHDIRKAIDIEVAFDYIIHAASITASSSFVEKPVETILTTILGTKNILDYAHRNGNCRVLYLSTMEVYGVSTESVVKEENFGLLNPFSLRSSYPESKRCAELLCRSYFSEYGVQTAILRPTLTFGSVILSNDNRVYAQFVRSVLQKQNIVLHTKGGTKRDYLYIYDAVRSSLTVLLHGESGEAYNISNPDSFCSILELAELACSFDSDISIVYEFDNSKYPPQMEIKLDNSKINKLNNFKRTSLKDMFLKSIILTKYHYK